MSHSWFFAANSTLAVLCALGAVQVAGWPRALSGRECQAIRGGEDTPDHVCGWTNPDVGHFECDCDGNSTTVSCKVSIDNEVAGVVNAFDQCLESDMTCRTTPSTNCGQKYNGPNGCSNPERNCTEGTGDCNDTYTKCEDV